MEHALSRLPHGPSFRFVDRLTSLEPGVRGAGEYRVRGDEPFLAGHFPDAPLFPGVLLIEACAQLAGIVAQSDPGRVPLTNLKLAAVRGARLLGSAVPGEIVAVTAEVTGRLGPLIQARAAAHVRGVPVARCELTLAGDASPDHATSPAR
ncbi:MAG: beta-hydroxyacyl-ACP dehydratase [Verrucomicrobiae bacterium]|nr:beta-hydroxyacyl-ACP dehydratase [Verrucomicrobiae bacterium]